MENNKGGNSDICMNSPASDEDMFASSQEVISSVATKSLDKGLSNECSRAESSCSLRLHSSDKEKTWRGTPINKLATNAGKNLYPSVAARPQHSVLFKLPVRKGEVPEPWPEKPVDVWDQNHVRMPHSSSSLYPITPTELKTRWELVQQGLTTEIRSYHQLEAAIFHYNSKYSDRWDFQGLKAFFSETLEEVETEYFFANVMPKVIELALNLPNLVTNGIPLLRKHVTQSISLTQQQISCLLANAFLCTFPRRNTSKKNSEYSTFPDINFNRLFHGDGAEASSRATSLQEKLKCLVNYFRRVTTKVPEGVVTYSRHHVSPEELPVWRNETARLPNLYVSSTGTIEDEGTGMLQMDFANKFVGGGVLGRGCVQEEIRFVICPELILARLFTEVLDDTEALIVSGCERFSAYTGYSDSFEWAGDIQDSTPRDNFGRRRCTLVAIDAFRFPFVKTQYSAANINRELNKAYAGFSWGMSSDTKESVATGNWGCGAYRGDAYLKALLQLMVAAKVGRDLAYFTFGNEELRDQLADMHAFLVEKQVSIGDLWRIITSYGSIQHQLSLYNHIYRSVNSGSIPSPAKTLRVFAPKKQRVEECEKNNGTKKSDKDINFSYLMNTEEIDKALGGAEEMEVDSEGVKPIEAKSLSVHNDKDLCLKRLSSSWTNLNESKRDFGSCERVTSSKSNSESLQSKESSNQYLASSKHSSSTNKKKKISDYFQTVSK